MITFWFSLPASLPGRFWGFLFSPVFWNFTKSVPLTVLDSVHPFIVETWTSSLGYFLQFDKCPFPPPLFFFFCSSFYSSGSCFYSDLDFLDWSSHFLAYFFLLFFFYLIDFLFYFNGYFHNNIHQTFYLIVYFCLHIFNFQKIFIVSWLFSFFGKSYFCFMVAKLLLFIWAC